MQRIPQQPCGELTGSISGGVWCYGWATHAGICIYLNFAGPRTAVEAIRAKLGKGQQVNCVPDDAPVIELSAGEGNSGKYSAYLQVNQQVKFTHCILVHEKILQPDYSGRGVTFILEASEQQVHAQVWQHVYALVKVAVFVSWTPYLCEAGYRAGLIAQVRSDGGIRIWSLLLDGHAWTRLITAGLAQGAITLG